MYRRQATVLLMLLTVSFLCLSLTVSADEGLWTFNDFPRDRVQKRYGFAPTDAWLEHVRLSSVRFNNGGSGSFVSPDGLVMTNHHVGSKCIQELGGSSRDYMANGFYAPTREQEAKCPQLELNVLMSISDVTSEVNAAVKPGMDTAARNAAQRAAMSSIEKECTTKTGLRCDVVVLYEGGRYNLYRYKKYTDVRLVMAPEADIAFFGGDPDNFTYPRYDLDVAFFRVYESNKPATVKHYLKWSGRGAQDGDLVFVSGNPGSTGRQLTVAQLEFLRDVAYPFRLNALKGRLDALFAYSRRGKEEARIARDTIFSYENSVKGMTGYQSGLLDANLMETRATEEQKLRAKVAADPKMKKEFGQVWEELAKAEHTHAGFYKQQQLLETTFGLRQVKLFNIARHLVRLPVETAKPNEKRLRDYRESALESLEEELYSPAPIYESHQMVLLAKILEELRDAMGATDPLVKQVLDGQSPEEAAKRYVAGTRLADVAERRKLAQGGKEAIEKSTDSMIRLARMVDQEARLLHKRYEDEVEAVERKNGALLAKAMFDLQGTSMYPEATFTLRLSYGQVKGYTENGKQVPWMTTFDGLYRKATGVDPYKLPQRWLDRKAKLRLDTLFNFVSTTDIIGGNSGSPVVNREGEVVGLIFDSNLQALPNRFLYREESERSVSVHTQGITEALEKIYDAGALVKELTAK